MRGVISAASSSSQLIQSSSIPCCHHHRIPLKKAQTRSLCCSPSTRNSSTTHHFLSSSSTSWDFKLVPSTTSTTRVGPRFSPRIGLRCNSNTGGPPGESDSKSVLDAFFLGKAFAEALNERIESTVGEFLSTIGRLQAEQQKQVQDFQEEVLERAKRAKEKAAREAMEAQGRISSSSTENVSVVADTPEVSNSSTDVSDLTPSEDENPTSTDPIQ